MPEIFELLVTTNIQHWRYFDLMKILGSEIKRFYNDESFSHLTDLDDIQIDIDDINELQDDVKYRLSELGVFYDEKKRKVVTFQAAFKEWKKAQKYKMALIEYDADKHEEVLKLLFENNIKLV